MRQRNGGRLRRKSDIINDNIIRDHHNHYNDSAEQLSLLPGSEGLKEYQYDKLGITEVEEAYVEKAVAGKNPSVAKEVAKDIVKDRAIANVAGEPVAQVMTVADILKKNKSSKQGPQLDGFHTELAETRNTAKDDFEYLPKFMRDRM